MQLNHSKKIIGMLVLLIPLSFTGQVNPKRTYTVYVNDNSGSIRAEVAFENKKKSVNETLSYSWYTSNKIMETKGGYDGRLLNGKYSAFYLSDNLKEQGSYENGLKDSQWKSWYENGNLKEVSIWNSGLRNGITKKFNQKGNLISEAGYKKGLLNGHLILYDENKIISKKKYKAGIEILPKSQIDSIPSKKKRILRTNEKKSDKHPQLLTSAKKRKSITDRFKELFKKEKDQSAITKNESN